MKHQEFHSYKTRKYIILILNYLPNHITPSPKNPLHNLKKEQKKYCYYYYYSIAQIRY